MRLLTLLFPAAYRSAHPAYAESFPIPTEQAPPATEARQNEAIAKWQGVWDGLKGITCPSLFVTGTEDVLAPPQNAVLMAARVPGSWLERFGGAGHGLMYQDPQVLAAAVVSFLAVTPGR
ncbi:MAG TPA: alpha/beta hydrolase [Thermoleophilia bacterium]|nr:alpha/beta hydrolase [Thermoleophilia bacterium]